jgi:putative transposase
MPYEYRSLTPEEREEVARQRRARGHPIHDPPHRGEGIYLLTAANFEYAPIMSSPERRTEFKAKLLEAMTNILAKLFGWGILPNHYHVLAGVAALEDVSRVLQKLRGSTAHAWKVQD